MMSKNAMGIVLAIALIAAVAFSGCLEEYPGYVEEETSTKVPEVTATPTTNIEEVEENETTAEEIVWTFLNEYSDNITSCSIEVGNYFSTLEYEKAQVQISNLNSVKS